MAETLADTTDKIELAAELIAAEATTNSNERPLESGGQTASAKELADQDDALDDGAYTFQLMEAWGADIPFMAVMAAWAVPGPTLSSFRTPTATHRPTDGHSKSRPAPWSPGATVSSSCRTIRPAP